MAKAADIKTVAIGLQGGGSHCAFSWGALDELLDKVEQGQLRITAISGASGGALNAAICAYGLREGPKEAQRLLKKFWISVSEQSLWPENPLRNMLPEDAPERWNVDLDPLAIGIGMAEQITSPYLNPWGSNNILRPLLADVIPDFSAFGRPDGNAPKLFISATAVDRTALRIFGPEEITIDALLASACLPTFFQAVMIEGTPYWDGGYLANPALNPLLDYADDLLTVLVDPLDVKSGPPVKPRQIVNRINEVSFNASWILEIRQIELINKLYRDGLLRGTKYKEKHLHLIRNDEFMEAIGATSKIVPSRDFLLALHRTGKATAKQWIAENFNKIGARSSFDMNGEVTSRLKGSNTSVAELKP
ncbi:MAG TPA: patatin-like phospholipase family protein [Acetobacteraceae bacterium]|nr:patatin-like phospholipase family protein [Acetobacteraceae bacterium]